MKNVKMLTILTVGTLCVPFYVNAESVSETWGNWSSENSEHEEFFSVQKVSDTELLEAETISIDNGVADGVKDDAIDVNADFPVDDTGIVNIRRKYAV